MNVQKVAKELKSIYESEYRNREMHEREGLLVAMLNFHQSKNEIIPGCKKTLAEMAKSGGLTYMGYKVDRSWL